MKKVDLKLYSEYERIQKEYNKLRKRLIKKTKKYDEENHTGNVPAMVIPQRHRKIPLRTAMKMSKREMSRRISALSKVVKEGEIGFFRKFKRSYFELYRMAIGEEPEGFNGYRYSEQQIAEMRLVDEGLASLMDSYNALFTMNAGVFYALLRRGDIPSFKMIYAEAVSGISFYESVLDRLSEIAHNWRRMSIRNELSKEDIEEFVKLSDKEKKKKVKQVSSTFRNVKKAKETRSSDEEEEE